MKRKWWRRFCPVLTDHGAVASFNPFPWLECAAININHHRTNHLRQAMHTHPRKFWTWIISGAYREFTPNSIHIRKAGDCFWRPEDWAHYIQVIRPVWSLVIYIGVKVKEEQYFPLCRECWTQDIIRLATRVHHVDLFRRGPLCDEHYQRKGIA